jgi:capsid protein
MKLLPAAGFIERARAREVAAGYEPKFLGADAATVNSYPAVFGGSSGYDALNNSPARSAITFPLGHRREFKSFTRIELLKKFRAIQANLGLIQRCQGQVSKYSVGRGVFPQPQTIDQAWNEEAATKFDDWANNRGVCDSAGAMTFWERQRYHAETLFGEGESFDALISSSFAGAPMLQLFDNSEVGSPYMSGYNREYVDGVKVSPLNRPISFLVTTAAGLRDYATSEVDATNMIHMVRRKRANQLRGLTPFAPGLNCAIDRMDLRALTTAAAKLHEAMGVVVKRKSGELGKNGMGAQITKELGEDGKLTKVNEKIFGPNIHYCGIDEEVEIVASDRPTQNLMAFGDELVRDVCLTTGLNFEIVWNLMTLGGATARIALADAQWFFDLIQDALNEMLNQRVWVWWCGSMMNAGDLSDCKDKRWWICHWQGPPKLTADAGRTMQGEIEALGNGLSSWADYYSRAQGRYWKTPIKQRIEELAWAMAECKKQDVPFEYLVALKPGVQLNLTAPEKQAE